MNKLEKVDKMIERLSNISTQFRRLKANAIKIDHHDIAIKTSTIIKNVDELADIFKEYSDALIASEIVAGTRKRVEIENLDKPKLTLIKGGKR